MVTNPVLVVAFVVVAMALGTQPAIADFDTSFDWAYALVLQPDGGIVAVGQSETNFAVARFGGEAVHR